MPVFRTHISVIHLQSSYHLSNTVQQIIKSTKSDAEPRKNFDSQVKSYRLSNQSQLASKYSKAD